MKKRPPACFFAEEAEKEEEEAPAEVPAARRTKRLYVPGDDDGEDGGGGEAAVREEEAAAARASVAAAEEDYMTFQVEEKAEEGIETPLGEENKGFQLLRKMGYSGGALGRTQGALVEPLVPQGMVGSPVGRDGVGRVEAKAKAAAAHDDAVATRAPPLKHLLQEGRSPPHPPTVGARLDDVAFKTAATTQAQTHATRSAARRARSAVRDMDERADLERNALWPSEQRQPTVASSNPEYSHGRRFTDASGVTYAEYDQETDEAGADEELDPSRLFDDEPYDIQLRAAVTYLRDVHDFCLVHGGKVDAESPSVDQEVESLIEEADE